MQMRRERGMRWKRGRLLAYPIFGEERKGAGRSAMEVVRLFIQIFMTSILPDAGECPNQFQTNQLHMTTGPGDNIDIVTNSHPSRSMYFRMVISGV